MLTVDKTEMWNHTKKKTKISIAETHAGKITTEHLSVYISGMCKTNNTTTYLDEVTEPLRIIQTVILTENINYL